MPERFTTDKPATYIAVANLAKREAVLQARYPQSLAD